MEDATKEVRVSPLFLASIIALQVKVETLPEPPEETSSESEIEELPPRKRPVRSLSGYWFPLFD